MSGMTTPPTTPTTPTPSEPRDEARAFGPEDFADLQRIAAGLAVLFEHHLYPPDPYRQVDDLAEFDARGAAKYAQQALARLALRYPPPAPDPREVALRAGLVRELRREARERARERARGREDGGVAGDAPGNAADGNPPDAGYDPALLRGWRTVPPGEGRD